MTTNPAESKKYDDPIPDRDTGVLVALNTAFASAGLADAPPEEPISCALFLAVAFRETAGQMRALGVWLLRHHKKGALGRNKALVLAAEELELRADALDRLAGASTETPIEHTERVAATLKATADDFTPSSSAQGDGPTCGATWQGEGFDPCILPADDQHAIHEGKNSKWPREIPADSPDAEKIKAGVLTSYSVGIENPQVIHANPEPGRLIPPAFETSIVEVSLNTEASVFPNAGIVSAVPVSDPSPTTRDQVVEEFVAAMKTIDNLSNYDPNGEAVQPGPDPFSEPVANGGRPYWLPEPQPRPYIPVDSPRPLAVHQSDIKLGEECGLALRLKYRDRVKPVPTWWNEGGHAFHACIERWERGWINWDSSIPGGGTITMSDDMAREWFCAALDAQISNVGAETGFDKSYWRAANKGTEDEAWWRENGPHMVRDYAAWSAKRHADGWSIAQVITDFRSAPALEANFSYPDPVTGLLREGTIDQLWIRKSTVADAYDVELIDPKTWRKPDEDPLQLAFYGGAIPTLLPGVPIASLRAAYYDGRAGALGELIDPTTAMDGAELSYRTAMIDAMHQTNVYPANPGTEYGKPCGICEFRYACPIMARRDAS